MTKFLALRGFQVRPYFLYEVSKLWKRRTYLPINDFGDRDRVYPSKKRFPTGKRFQNLSDWQSSR
jgi:hypothetical protein